MMKICISLFILTISLTAKAAEDSSFPTTTRSASEIQSENASEATLSAAASVVNMKKSEAEIPVFSDKKAEGASVLKAGKSSDSTHKIAVTLAILTGVCGGTYLMARKWLKKAQTENRATQIKVMTQHMLGPKKSLAVVRVAGENLLLGITDNNITLIKELALIDDEIPAETPNQFADSLNQAEVDADADVPNWQSGIKDMVQKRLKGSDKWV
jgi:flagellar protein FliO/FliZ